jgi:plasmid stabilization system protein ParE
MRVVVHSGASRDLFEIADWLEEDSASARERFIAEFDSAQAFLSAHPGVGHPSGRFRRWNLQRFRYHLLYQIDEKREELWIMVVRHDSRHPAYGTKRRIPGETQK